MMRAVAPPSYSLAFVLATTSLVYRIVESFGSHSETVSRARTLMQMTDASTERNQERQREREH